MTTILGFGVPVNKVIYYINGKTILDAMTLQPEQSEVTGVYEVKGNLTTEFGVNPYFVSTENNEYFLIYAPQGDDRIYDSEGKEPKIDKMLTCDEILIPDINLKPVKLGKPNYDSVVKYVEQHNMQPQLYDDSALIQEIKTIRDRLESLPKTNQRDESVNSELISLRNDVAQLYDVMDALIRRIYEIYPVTPKTPLRIKNMYPTEINLGMYEQLKQQGQIMNEWYEPILQPYVSSHRKMTRVLTVFTKDGKAYYVICSVDPKTGEKKAIPQGSQ